MASPPGSGDPHPPGEIPGRPWFVFADCSFLSISLRRGVRPARQSKLRGAWSNFVRKSSSEMTLEEPEMVLPGAKMALGEPEGVWGKAKTVGGKPELGGGEPGAVLEAAEAREVAPPGVAGEPEVARREPEMTGDEPEGGGRRAGYWTEVGDSGSVPPLRRHKSLLFPKMCIPGDIANSAKTNGGEESRTAGSLARFFLLSGLIFLGGNRQTGLGGNRAVGSGKVGGRA